MTVTVNLPGGGSDKYMRYGDVYVEHGDGALEIIRTGRNRPYRYEAGAWVGVMGDQKTWKTGRFWG
jgi:hypothetical protein